MKEELVMPDTPFPPYRAPWWARNGHVSTAWGGLIRKGTDLDGRVRQRLELPDGDFLDLDLLDQGQDRIVVLLHGLEGDTSRPYMTGMAASLQDRGWAILMVNFRGCSGTPNRLFRSYHTGETGDLRQVIRWLADQFPNRHVALVGFSLGGNVLLKFLGEEGEGLTHQVLGGVAFSAPVDLTSASRQLDQGVNRVYVRRFLDTLIPKAVEKVERFGAALDIQRIRKARTFAEFDEAFTAPLYGFRDASDYWSRASALPWLGSIHCPALLVNARNDPFLGKGCYPAASDLQGTPISLCTPLHGGHVGFPGSQGTRLLWTEALAARFLEGCMENGG